MFYQSRIRELYVSLLPTFTSVGNFYMIVHFTDVLFAQGGETIASVSLGVNPTSYPQMGFGKTTLVGDWLQQLDLPAAWLSLDESDNDPTRFLT